MMNRIESSLALLFAVQLVMSGCSSPCRSRIRNVAIGPTKGSLIHNVNCIEPGLITLPDGTLLAAYQCGPINAASPSDYSINIQLSTDKGSTWSPSTPVISSGTPYDAVSLSLLSSGDVFLGFGGSIPTYMIGTRNGDDLTWSTPVSVSTPAWKNGCAAVSPLVQLANGNLLWPVWCQSNITGGLPGSSTVLLSTDGGVTWLKQITVANGDTDGNDYDESAAVVFPNGHIIMIIRQSSMGNVDYDGTWLRSLSADGGNTWSTPLRVVDTYVVGRPSLLLLPSGGLVLLGRIRASGSSSTGFATSRDEGLVFSCFSGLGVDGPGGGIDRYDAISLLPDRSVAVVSAHGNNGSNIDYRNLIDEGPTRPPVAGPPHTLDILPALFVKVIANEGLFEKGGCDVASWN